MVSLTVECEEAESEFLSAEMWEQGALGIQEDPLPNGRCRLRAWFDHADGLSTSWARFQPTIETEPALDWEELTRQAWQPFPVGERLYLAPEWDESSTPAGRIRLTVHPGQAYGTGTHASTHVALEALEKHLLVGESVVDVGTGSGILMSAALALGAGVAVGCDIDAEAVPIARRNLLADGLTAPVFTGSTRSLRDASFDVLVANINAASHRAAAGEFARLCRRLLILSGFSPRHAESVRAAMAAYSFSVLDTLTRDDWVCLILSRDAIS